MTSDKAIGREDLFAGKVSDGWAAACGKEQARFEAFCKRLALPSDHPFSLALYLTWLHESEGATGKQIDVAVNHLDTMARVRGNRPWRRQPEVARFLRGLYRRDRRGPSPEAAAPLYRELVEVLVSAVTALEPDQQRDRAAVLLRHHTGLDIRGLMALRWRDIRLTRKSAEVTPTRPAGKEWHTAARGGPTCLVDALARLRSNGAHPDGRVLAVGASAREGVQTALTAANNAGDDLSAQVKAATHSNLQDRDRAILLIAYGAALTRSETISLRQRHLTVTSEGLRVAVPSRPTPTDLRADPGMPGDPVAAWEAWRQALHDHGRAAPDRPAFLRATRETILDTQITKWGLKSLMDRAVAAAGLTGTYTFHSLRWGLIRTAFRADEPVHVVAAHLGLKTLGGAAYHQRRENMIRHSVAGQLGL